MSANQPDGGLTDLHSNMQNFDACPRPLRDALNDAIHDWDARCFRRLLHRRHGRPGLSVSEVVEYLKQLDQQVAQIKVRKVA